jgi:hypothetical protein
LSNGGDTHYMGLSPLQHVSIVVRLDAWPSFIGQ